MKIIIAPTKQMKFKDDLDMEYTTPLFVNESLELRKKISDLDLPALKKIMKISDKMASKVFDLYHTDHPQFGCAILSYSGIAFQYMAPGIFTDDQLEYIDKHLRIVSGLYGIVRPFDQIEEYRLEMQTKLPFPPYSLYEFWNDKIASALEDDLIINLASEEYAKCVRPYKPLIDVRFLDHDGKEKGVYVKMARGEMVRFMAENHITDPEKLKAFDRQGYRYDEKASTETTYVFRKERS